MEREKQCEIYRIFINRMIEEITSVEDLKRIYTLVCVKHEKYE